MAPSYKSLPLKWMEGALIGAALVGGTAVLAIPIPEPDVIFRLRVSGAPSAADVAWAEAPDGAVLDQALLSSGQAVLRVSVVSAANGDVPLPGYAIVPFTARVKIGTLAAGQLEGVLQGTALATSRGTIYDVGPFDYASNAQPQRVLPVVALGGGVTTPGTPGTRTPGATATPTTRVTGTTTVGPSSTPTPTPTRTPLPSRTADGTGCAGDCSGDASVAINELITAVNIALGSAPVDGCRSVDVSGDGMVAINELIGAVNNALNGCASESE